jgi:hypothetical protein
MSVSSCWTRTSKEKLSQFRKIMKITKECIYRETKLITKFNQFWSFHVSGFWATLRGNRISVLQRTEQSDSTRYTLKYFCFGYCLVMPKAFKTSTWDHVHVENLYEQQFNLLVSLQYPSQPPGA